MKRKFFVPLFILLVLLSDKICADVPDSVYLFIYNSAPRSGLQLAYSADRQRWIEIGCQTAFISSDFGSWGRTGKNMYNPTMCQLPDGSWVCVFSVGEGGNQFAVAYAYDLARWRPQEYPYMEGVGSCLAPVVSYNSNDGKYKVVFRTIEGGVYVTYSDDLYHFTSPQSISSEDYPNVYESVWLNGVKTEGQVLRVSYDDVKVALDAAVMKMYWAGLNDEVAKDNSWRFKDLQPVEADITIDASRTKKISDKLIGIFFEDINYSADGGLYAELVQNRDFEYNHRDNGAWNAQTSWLLEGAGATWEVLTDDPIHKNNVHYVALDVLNADDVALVNEGFDGISVKKGEKYDFSVFARQLSGKGGKLKVELVADGNVIAQTTVKAPSKEWKKLTAILRAETDAKNAVLKIVPMGVGKVALDMVSLFPQNTFKGHKNGLRADLAQVLADLNPKFMRFPGGCLVHGNGLANIYNWKETIGPLESRVAQPNIWGYHQSKGLGFYEYFQFCEDLGMEPLPVLAAGVSCQNSSRGGAGQQGGIPMDKMDEYVQDVLDLVEWANGDAKTTVWGKKRAEQGHPEPFNLKYLGIGNEDLISETFKERYLMLINAVSEKYPDIIICGTAGPWSEGSDYEEGWRLADKYKIDMIDEHYYQSPGWFINHYDYYDSYDRNGSKVYLGEYAAHAGGRPSNIETALCEALHICGMERNGDVVAMASYAPLLAKEGRTQWRPDLIYFNNTDINLTVNYYVQKLCGNFCGDEYIASELSLNQQTKGVRERVAISTVRSTSTGKVYIKLVNLLDHAVSAKLNLESLWDVFDYPEDIDGKVHLLTGSWDETKATPKDSDIKVGKCLNYELPAYSLSVIEL